MNLLVREMLQKLGFRQQTYKQAFGEGTALHLVLTDLANYSRAFEADTDGITHDDLMKMHGRRQMFFYIIHHLKLAPPELELVYGSAIVKAARRVQTIPMKDHDDD